MIGIFLRRLPVVHVLDLHHRRTLCDGGVLRALRVVDRAAIRVDGDDETFGFVAAHHAVVGARLFLSEVGVHVAGLVLGAVPAFGDDGAAALALDGGAQPGHPFHGAFAVAHGVAGRLIPSPRRRGRIHHRLGDLRLCGARLAGLELIQQIEEDGEIGDRARLGNQLGTDVDPSIVTVVQAKRGEEAPCLFFGARLLHPLTVRQHDFDKLRLGHVFPIPGNAGVHDFIRHARQFVKVEGGDDAEIGTLAAAQCTE